MRIVIFGHEAHLEDLEEQVPQGKFLMSNSIEEIKNFILGDELTFLIIDIDDVEGLGAHLNSDYLSFASVKRIVCSGHFSAIDFKKHQISEDGADGYLKKPLGAKDILDLLEDFSHYYEEIHQTTEPLNVPSSEEESLDQEKQPFESKLNNQIQQKFDYVYEEKLVEENVEEKEEVSIPFTEEEPLSDDLSSEIEEEPLSDDLPPEIEE
ncbi:MAG: hypothetical protein VYD54_09320, partial [Bdellovibrionota bacterium]|nr:hypothetical protein [Bdellovibrionota bacterium]